jgi:hypothetical protein
MQENQEAHESEYREEKPPEEPHPDEPRGTSLPPSEDAASEADPDEISEAGAEGTDEA